MPDIPHHTIPAQMPPPADAPAPVVVTFAVPQPVVPQPVVLQPAAPQPVVPRGRDPRLDVFRGLCLVMIFINHVPGNMFENFTSRNWGHSDAAEGFVLMSGIAAGLAYSADFRAPMRLWTGLSRVWKRVWTLYLVHLLISMSALGIAALLLRHFDNPGLFDRNMMQFVVRDPVGVLIGLPILTHQFGYANILPLYLVLLAFAPLTLMAAWRWPGWLLAGSLVLWAVTAHFKLNLPNYPVRGGWFFNPLAWQVVFTLGLLTGVAMRDGRRFVPVRRWLQWLTGGFLVLCLAWVKVPPVSELMNHTLWQAQQAGVPSWITAFDKTYVTAPRLLHIMALGYFLSSLPVVKRIAGSAIGAPFALLGRQALPVFALGSILCFLFQGIKLQTGTDLLTDSVLIAGGLGLQFALAAARQYWPEPAPRLKP